MQNDRLQGDTDRDEPGSARVIARNTAYQIAGRVWATAVSLASIAIATRYLGTEGFGVLATALAYFYFFWAFADWGTYTFAVREVAKRPEETRRIVSSTLFLRLILSLIVMVFAAGIAVALPYDREVQIVIFVLLATVPLTTLVQSSVVVFQATLQMKYSALAEGLSRLAGLGAIVVVVALDLGLIAVASTYVLSSAVAVLLSLYWLRRFTRIERRPDLRYGWQVLVRSIPIGVASIVISLYFKVDTILLSLLRDVREVGIYGVAYRVLEVLLTVPSFLSLSVFPLVSRAVDADERRTRGLVQSGFDALVLIGLPTSVLFVIAAPAVVNVIAGAEFHASTVPLRILMAALAFYFVNVLMGYLLIAKDRQGHLLRVATLGLVLNVTANLFAIPRYGYLGAAWVTFGSEAVVTFTNVALVRMAYGFAPRLDVLVKVVVSVGSAALAALAVQQVGDERSLPSLAAVSLSFGAVYLGSAYLLGALRREHLEAVMPSFLRRRGAGPGGRADREAAAGTATMPAPPDHGPVP